MAVVWTDVISTTSNGIAVKYQRETSPPDAGTGAGNRHRLVENGVAFGPSPQDRPARSPHFMAATWDPFRIIDYNVHGGARLLYVDDVTP